MDISTAPTLTHPCSYELLICEYFNGTLTHQLSYATHTSQFKSSNTFVTTLVVLFILFILLCGLGHLLRCMDMEDTQYFIVVNTLTAIASMITALSFMVLVPNFVDNLDHGLKGVEMLDHVTKTKQRKLPVFMAFLCHEIRNPLFAITSAMTFLGDDPLTENQQSALASIHEAANLMLRIVNDVLDISKIESGKLELEKHDFNLRQLLEGVATSTRAQIKQTNKLPIDFNFSIEKDVPTIVSGDSARLLQIA
jgi:signal transduction histidine kinase